MAWHSKYNLSGFLIVGWNILISENKNIKEGKEYGNKQ